MKLENIKIETDMNLYYCVYVWDIRGWKSISRHKYINDAEQMKQHIIKLSNTSYYKEEIKKFIENNQDTRCNSVA